MNNAARTFYAGLHERVTLLLENTRHAQAQAETTRQLADDMTNLLDKARRLEALIDRLDEYTAKQEASLTSLSRHQSSPHT